MITRRRLIALLPAAAAGIHTRLQGQVRLFPHKPKPRPPAAQPFVYFGTDTNHPAAKGIYVSRFDPATGRLTQPVLAAPSLRPAYLAPNQVQINGRTRRLLYAVNEGADAQTSAVTAFLIDPATGALNPLGKVSSAGAGPCYIAVDATRRSAFIANNAGGSIASYLVQPDGTLSPPVERIDFHNTLFGQQGPNATRQDGPHPHSAMLSPDNRFLVVNDLGNDDIVLFPVYPETARLGKPTVIHHRTPGAGPRHLTFHPNGRWAYGIDEISSRIDQYLFNTTRGSASVEPEARLTDVGRPISTLDPGFHSPNTAAELVLAPSGQILYASNRGEDSLVVFALDSTNGALTVVQRVSCGGKTPRHFTLDLTGRWLLCGNQDSASITVFSRHPTTGQLAGPIQTVSLESPMYIQFA